MKLLILTQKVDMNDDVLGFFHDWVKEFAKNCEKVIVICLYKGEYDLPDNVKVLSLGKEGGASKIKYLSNFYKYIWQERKNYDSVFAHMNQVYVILGGLLWRVWGKRIGLWYTHKQVNCSLRIAEKITDIIFTASSESFGIKSKKVNILGHGINIEKFKPLIRKDNQEFFNILYVGRISKIKNQQLLIEAVDCLIKNGEKNIKVRFVGGPIYSQDQEYLEQLKKIISDRGLDSYIEFAGSVPNKDILSHYQWADLSLNLCPTGGMDKAVLESMACSLPVIVLNKTFAEILKDYKDELILKNQDAKELSEKITHIKNLPQQERENMEEKLSQIIIKDYSLDGLIKKIVKNIL